MATNFYLMGHKHDDSPEYHIGKRSAAGLYCWNCRITLCEQGESAIHSSESTFSDKCPKCGKKYEPKPGWHGAGAVELGFAQPYAPDERKGIDTCSSFTWAMNPERLRSKRKVTDEYGRVYTIAEFNNIVLDNCPIQYKDSIGHEFS